MIPVEMDAEKACVGIVMDDQAALLDMDLTGDDFRDPRLGALWDLIVSMDARGEPTTPAAVLAAAPALKMPGLDGPLIFDCYQARPVAALASKYSRIVAGAATLRRLANVGLSIAQLTMSAEDPEAIVEMVRAKVDAVSRHTAGVRFVGQTIDETIDTLDSPTRAMQTPWPDLNRLIKGWRPGALYVVAARPGVGKTIIGLQAAVGLAEHGIVAFNSLEMPEREIHARLLAQTARVALGRLDGTSGEAEPLSPADWSRIAGVRARIADMPLSVDDRSGVTVMDIRSHARTLSRRGKLAGVVVDYLQLMSAPRGDRRPRHEVVAEYSRSLKLLAKELDCPVIALSQLNRQSEARQDKRPQLSDLRESGSIEQDADVVLLLHAPQEESPDMDMLVAKNRHGVVGPVLLTRRGEFALAEARQWSPHRTVTQPNRRDLS